MMLVADIWGIMPGIMALTIPIIAIIGGITVGIVKSIGRQRIQELAQRERIAAIERGLDVSKLPPPPITDPDDLPGPVSRTRQGLLIGGIVTLFAGAGLSFMLLFLSDDGTWAVGAIPMAVGAGLLLSYKLIRPLPNGSGRNYEDGAPPMA